MKSHYRVDCRQVNDIVRHWHCPVRERLDFSWVRINEFARATVQIVVHTFVTSMRQS